jgi:hypothetical protein
MAAEGVAGHRSRPGSRRSAKPAVRETGPRAPSSCRPPSSCFARRARVRLRTLSQRRATGSTGFVAHRERGPVAKAAGAAFTLGLLDGASSPDQ